MSAARVSLHAVWGLIAFLSVGVGGYALFHVATGFEFLPAEIKANAFFSPLGLQTHIAASGIAMILGAFQFLKALRTKAPAVHRWSGRVYVAACLVGGGAGLAIALYSSAGPVAGWGFFFLAVFWLLTTSMAWSRALRRDFIAHERWMIRSFALTLAAVTLRLQLPIGAPIWGFEAAYPIIAWTCWVPNLIVAEIWIATRRKPRRAKATQAPAAA
jgi:uncharacterized membrane protein